MEADTERDASEFDAVYYETSGEGVGRSSIRYPNLLVKL
jgi:hypothetical protein